MHAGPEVPAVAILFSAALVCLLILVNAQAIGEALGILDHPDTVRKRHAKITPLVGGLAIMVPLILWSGVWLFLNPDANQNFILTVLLCGAGATLVGYADDQASTSPSSRLLSLFLLSAIAMVIDPAAIPAQLNWGSFDPTMLPRWLACAFIAVAMAGYVNAVNMADGQNGVVTGMYLIWAVCLMLVTGGSTLAVAELLAVIVLITFLFNLAGQVFIGDSGSYGVTFVFGLLAINAHNRWHVSAETIAVWFFIPVMDCIRLMVSRALAGQAPSEADRDHFHHRLQDRVGKTIGLCIYMGVVGSTSLVASLQPHLSLICMILLAAFYFSFAWLTASGVEEEAELPDEAVGELKVVGKDNVVKFDGKESSSSR